MDGAAPNAAAGSGATAEAQPHLILIDGSGYIFRAFHALPPMTRPDGVPVNAVFGFSNMLGQFLTKHVGSHIAVVFDTSRKTFRSDFYPDYKAHRPEPPPELVPQFALIREATAAFGVAGVELDGFEADDLIAGYAKAFVETGGQVTVVSSDKDLMQLVRPGVQLLDPIKQKPIREPEVLEKFGVTPDKVVDVQALAGDSTDNVPGVPGIGIKTAAQLILEYGDLEGLLAAADKIKQPKRREALLANAELARISRRLVLLDENCPLPSPIDALLARAPEPTRLSGFLREQGFRSMLHRMGLDGDTAPESAPVSRPRQAFQLPGLQPEAAAPEPVSTEAAPFGPYETISDPSVLAQWVAEARASGLLAIDTETDGLDALNANLVGISLAVAPGRACYIPLRHGPPPGTGDMLQEAPVAPPQMTQDEAVDALRPLLADPSVLKILHNAKFDLEVLGRAEHGALALAPVDDTMLISYSMDAGRHGHGMDELSLRHLGHRPISFDEVTGTGRARIPFTQVAMDKATAYAAEDADVTLRLWQALRPKLLPQKALTLYEQVERRMVAVLREMELAGIKVDGAELARIGEDFSQRMVVLEQAIHTLAGKPFNVGSPKQLGEILFDEQKLPGGKRGKAGAWGTDAAVLEDLAARGHELPRQVMNWRQLAKLKSTYVEGLAAQIDPRDRRVHTDFSMAITSTGRLSSTEPNLQNIPIRSEEGVRIRRAFVAEPGHVLLAADYSQIELRLLAHLADVPSLRDAFEKGEDIHSRTASDIFGLPRDQVDKEARRRAKTINFGIIYGMSAFGLAARLGISPGEARGIIDAYFSQYPGILEEMERLKSEARETGYVMTPFGRRLWIDGIQAKEQARRGNAERAAINAPFQGGAAEIIKRAMVRMPAALKAANLSARMLLQVHDELLFEVPQGEVTATAECVRVVMEGVAELRVPLKAEIGFGANWAEAH
ncbi:DNA polymerase I [Roseomonas sp. 18066]|uniref:DNA polymerase I n=1 Tax=Roseomonas sp. 18066 TaxID=2681412 RepID=UPI00135B754C|nr:DNA polymerase I [Roseomonas sp. 18066]